MAKEFEFANDLIDFIHRSPSPYHVVENLSTILIEKGFVPLSLTDRWNLTQGGKYFVTRNDSAAIAFVVGDKKIEEAGFRMVAAHTDAPCLRLKPSPEMVMEDTYLTLNTEVYGSPILNTWLDRPLSIAGRVSLRGEHPWRPESRLVQLHNSSFTIPNQSLHMNREVNEGIELNKQIDMSPLIAGVKEDFEKDRFLAKQLATQLDVGADRIIDFDLILYAVEKGILLGMDQEFISSAKLDNLAMVHAGLHALIGAGTVDATSLLVCFDNEEIGSRTKQGAASPFLRNVLERIVIALGKNREDYFRSIYASYLLSADMGHGLHPNALQKHDPVNRPVLNGGPMIKVAANQNFTTDGDLVVIYEELCRGAGIPVQRFVSRSDMRSGSTIGPIASTQLDVRSLDVGNPVLAMHSIRELGGVQDHALISQSFKSFYEV